MSEFKRKSQLFNEKLGVHLKAMRNEQRYTMRALAEQLETPHSFIGKTEQCNRRLDVGEFVQYCQALDIDASKVIKALQQ